jgi:hypothetical protein
MEEDVDLSVAKHVHFGVGETDCSAAYTQVITIPALEDYQQENLVSQLWWDEKSLGNSRSELRTLADAHMKNEIRTITKALRY